MAKALRSYANRTVPATEKLHEDQVANNAGGFSFTASDHTRLVRFLVLGSDGGTYYVDQNDLTKSNVDFIRKMIQEDPQTVLSTTVSVSESGRAYRNDAAIFILALMLAEVKNFPKQAIVDAVPKVCRTAAHVYELAEFINSMSGWGQAKMRAIRAWFDSKTPDELAYQAVKYRQRNGWTLKDVMRLSHPVGINPVVANFILRGEVAEHEAAGVLSGFQKIQNASSVTEVVRTLDTYSNLPWEAIPTQFLKEPKVWKKLFENGQLRGQALVRNVTRLAKLGMFDDLVFAREYASRLTDENMIRKTRLHPMQYLNAYVVYGSGQLSRDIYRGDRRKTWSTSGIIQDALDDGFGLSFGNIEPSGMRMMISVDVSTSMSWASAGSSDLTCAQAAGAMALVTARVEPHYIVNGFSGGLVDLGITARDSISAAFNKVQKRNFGTTNPSAPVVKAIDTGQNIDAFVIITDNEVNSGYHVHDTLKRYRRKSGIPARMVVMGMTANDFSIADPSDPLMLDVAGFDTNTPKVVSDFSAGRI